MKRYRKILSYMGNIENYWNVYKIWKHIEICRKIRKYIYIYMNIEKYSNIQKYDKYIEKL